MRKGTKVVGIYLDEYKVINKIADGGNSEVYLVTDVDGNEYALKLLNKNLTKEKIKRFKNEMDFCQRTNHENIIKVVDNGNIPDKEELFYIMHIYNKTLRDYINDDHSIEELLGMFISILNGVNYYISKGIIHRDIKPENILISNEGIPVITDFGIAHFEEDELKTIVKTRINSKMANFQYASPEQREIGTTISYKSDIFSLGLILNEMFTKKVPSGASYKRVKDINDEYAFIDKVINKMIAQNPKDRYDSINEIVSDIKALVRVHEKEVELQKLKEIEYKGSEENDILILEPPKLIDFKYNDTLNTLYLYLDKEVNQFWVDCITKGSYTSIWGKGPETFRFEGKTAMAKIMPYEINELQTVIDYFKSWVNNANSNYSRLVKAERERTRHEEQRKLEERIKREERINEVLKTIKI